MKKGVTLQRRDFEVLASVYGCTVMSFEQVKRKHFASVNDQTASNRLNRLCHGGYIRKHRVGLIMYQGTPRSVQVVYTLTPESLRALRHWPDVKDIREEPVVLNTYTLIHDLLLNDVVDGLRRRNPGQRTVNTKVVSLESIRNEQVPDAVMELDDDTGSVAIELELTVKSGKRYREIIAHYRVSERYQKVIFVYEDDLIRRKVMTVLGQEPGPSQEKPETFSKFEFVPTRWLLETNQDAPETTQLPAA